MASNNKYSGIFMSRIMPCEKCRLKGYPKKGQTFITFGGMSQKYKIHEVGSNVRTRNEGLTPHFVQCLGPNKADTGMIIISNCCINGCEITLNWNEKKGIYDITFENVNASFMPFNEWEALLFRWHGGTGLEI